MTAQVDAYKPETTAATHLIGQDWQKLIDMIESRPGDNEVKSFDGGGGSHGHHRSDDNVLRALQDVKRLRQKDMPLFGRCPETDTFYTVVCSSCSMILMPHALKDHYEKRHGDSGKSSHSPNDKQTSESPNKAKSKKVQQQPLKLDKVDKSKRPKSESGPAEDPYKDTKPRLDKLKKGKTAADKAVTETPTEPPPATTSSTTTTTPPNLRSDPQRGKQKNSRFALELQPVVALSPIQVADTESESNDSKDLPKTKKRDRKKNDRKSDKLYDPDKHCGVINDAGKPCVRSILCKVHQVAMKRAVPKRTMPYDMLIRMLKTNPDDEKPKADSCLLRLPKAEPVDGVSSDTRDSESADGVQPCQPWSGDEVGIKTEEPPTKRLKIKEEVMEEDVDQNQFTLPSHLEALIDETLKTLKDVDEGETLPILPIVPKAEPLIRWDLDRETVSSTTTTTSSPSSPPPPPPHIFLEDIHWHSSHPKPLATNTFGCRLIGGLMSTCKKLDTLRRHLQSVWSSSASSPTIRSSFNDVIYNSAGGQSGPASNTSPKGSFTLCKYVKKPSQNTGKGPSGAPVKKAGASPGAAVAAAAAAATTAPTTAPLTGQAVGKGSVVKRKRRSNSNVIAPVQNATANASDIISGLLISNSVPVQRTSVPTIPTGVIPVNSITGNGVPLRLFQGSLPVIASASPNQPATFIQLNLCPPK